MAEKGETTTSFRACFSTDAGKRALGRILIDSGFFDTDLKTESDIARENFAKEILQHILGGEKKTVCGPDVVDSFVQKLFELPNK